MHKWWRRFKYVMHMRRTHNDNFRAFKEALEKEIKGAADSLTDRIVLLQLNVEHYLSRTELTPSERLDQCWIQLQEFKWVKMFEKIDIEHSYS